MSDLIVRGLKEGGLAHLELLGEARLECVGELERAADAVLDGTTRDLLVDLSGLDFMDSASAGAFLRLDDRLARGGGRLVLHSLPRLLERLVERTGLNQALLIAPDEAAARALLR
jgi:anti-anti-sigma factor